jgi:hypothetical protein
MSLRLWAPAPLQRGRGRQGAGPLKGLGIGQGREEMRPGRRSCPGAPEPAWALPAVRRQGARAWRARAGPRARRRSQGAARGRRRGEGQGSGQEAGREARREAEGAAWEARILSQRPPVDPATGSRRTRGAPSRLPRRPCSLRPSALRSCEGTPKATRICPRKGELARVPPERRKTWRTSSGPPLLSSSR